MSASKRSRPANSASPSASGRTSRVGGAQAPEPRGSRIRWARWLWAAVIALALAALLFEFTMVWTIGVGTYMISLGELMGLWFLVGGYVLACVPPAFGLLVGTGSFWRSMTHALWIGLLYGAAGFLLLDQAAGLTI